MKKLVYAMLIVGAVGALWAQDPEPRPVETNANYNLWVIRGANGVCATVMELEGRRYIRPAPGYTIEVIHDDKRASVASPFEAPAESKGGIPYPEVRPYPNPDGKKGAK